MPPTADFYSVHQLKKLIANRAYHNNYACSPGRAIPLNERKYGSNGYKLCHNCDNLNRQGR